MTFLRQRKVVSRFITAHGILWHTTVFGKAFAISRSNKSRNLRTMSRRHSPPWGVELNKPKISRDMIAKKVRTRLHDIRQLNLMPNPCRTFNTTFRISNTNSHTYFSSYYSVSVSALWSRPAFRTHMQILLLPISPEMRVAWRRSIVEKGRTLFVRSGESLTSSLLIELVGSCSVVEYIFKSVWYVLNRVQSIYWNSSNRYSRIFVRYY